MSQDQSSPRGWAAHPIAAASLRAAVFLAPILSSIVFVHFASRVVPPWTGSLALFLAWWFAVTAAATGVLIAIDRLSRRLLPLVALLKLSLVFPDQAPSRFKTALRSRSVDSLEDRVHAAAKAPDASAAAERLLELITALNDHDHITRGHSERVRAYSVMIGEELGLRKGDLDRLNWAALLHDIGKLSVSGEILNKNGRPNDEEWAVLRKHPLFGEQLVAPLRAWLGEWIDAVGYHHEHWDGKGYPRGMEGDEIPLAGRIVAVADVFDVITSARSYKEASGAVEGRSEISRCAGTQFDPKVARALVGCSLGRMRLVMGPLSWLAHAPLLARLPLMPLAGTLASSLGVIAASTAGGLIAPANAPAADRPAAPTHVAVHTTPTRHVASPPKVGMRHTQSHHHVARRRSPAAVPVRTPVAAPPPPAAAAARMRVTDDLAAVASGATIEIDVLANDSVSTGASLVLTSVDAPRHGNTSVDGNRIRFVAPSDWAGNVTFGYTVSDATDGVTGSAVVKVTIQPPESKPAPPTLTLGSDQRVDEDSGPQRVVLFAKVTAAGNASFTVESDQPQLFVAGPAIAPDGTLSYTPAPNANGIAQVRVSVDDRGRPAETGTFAIRIVAVNDPPTFTPGSNQAVLQDAGPQTVAGWAKTISPGPSDERAQAVSFRATVDVPALFSARPLLSPDGTLTYTPADGAVGTAHVTVTASDDGGTADGGDDTSKPVTFTIAIGGINHAPTFTAGADQSVLEDAAAERVAAWATKISPGPTAEAGQSVRFDLTDDSPALFLVTPSVDSSGALVYRPAANANGVAHLTVRARDDGGTANGGEDTSAPQSFTIAIAAVNDAPSFVAGSNQTVLEDAGAQSVASWATSISSGPADEAAQTVTFSVSSDNAALFAAGPTVASNGTLSYTPAANANGLAHVTVRAVDNGGTANGGVDTSVATVFTIAVTAVNDAPSFVVGANQTVTEGDAAQNVPAWASGIAAGPADESAQTISFLTADGNPGIFATGFEPAVSANGTLSFTPSSTTYGSATVTVQDKDNGGTANGGTDTSAGQSFTITVLPRPPVAVNDSYTTPTLITLNEGPAQGVLANDNDPNSLPLTASIVTGPSSGTLILSSDGSFSYTASLLFVGTDSFTYRASNGSTSSTATVTIVVTLI